LAMATPKRKVMISLQCKTMGESSVKLKDFLEKNGLEVWLCMEMAGGESYRDSIVDAIDAADFVVIMLNNEWALSGECTDEYNYAKRLNLTSYETGKSARPDPRRPVFVPIAYNNLDWNAHKHVRLLSSSTNMIVHDGLNLNEGNFDKTMTSVMTSIQKAFSSAPGSTPTPAAAAPKAAAPAAAAKPAAKAAAPAKAKAAAKPAARRVVDDDDDDQAGEAENDEEQEEVVEEQEEVVEEQDDEEQAGEAENDEDEEAGEAENDDDDEVEEDEEGNEEDDEDSDNTRVTKKKKHQKHMNALEKLMKKLKGHK